MNIEVQKAFGEAVKARVAANGGSGWGGADSLAVIEKIADVAYLGDSPEGFDAIKDYVLALVNPSAFRQSLEKKGLVREGEKGKRGNKPDLLADLTK